MPPAHLYPHHLQKLREVDRSGTIFVHHINQILREDIHEKSRNGDTLGPEGEELIV